MTDIEKALAESKSIKGLLLDAEWTLDELLGALSHDGLTIAPARQAAIGAAVERYLNDTGHAHVPFHVVNDAIEGATG